MNNIKLENLTYSYFSGMNSREGTVAFWCVTGKEFNRIITFTPEHFWLKMASQFSAEGQASVGDDDIWGDPKLKNDLILFAPIQLACNWSPLPFMEKLLGIPDHLALSSAEPKVAFACWQTPILSACAQSYVSTIEEKHTDRLLKSAIEKKMPFACICFAGFSFTNRKLSKVTQQAMRNAGFTITSRSAK
jgi:hypothetical protein